jgi:hypothetical protein
MPKRFLMQSEPLLTKTSDLDRRFNIGKTTRVSRLSLLGLTSDQLVKQGHFYFLSEQQVELFAGLDQYIRTTGSPDGYAGLPQTFNEPAEDLENSFVEEEMDDESEGYLVASPSQDLAETSPVTEGEYCYPDDVYQMQQSTLLMMENAQRRATALMLAENALVQQYMNDPSLLKPELRQQISNLEYREIDPKELAASLIAEAQSYMGGAA